MKLKSNHISFLCLVIAVVFLYARDYFILSEHTDANQKINKSLAANLDTSDLIIIHYHERPPYYITGTLDIHGLCCDPVKIAFTNAGIPFKWQKTPAKRQLEILKNTNSKECIAGWFKSEEREKFAKYSHYIYQDKPVIAIARSDNYNIKLNRSLEEILKNKNLILLKKNGYSYGQFIDKKILELKPVKVITNSKNIMMLKMIHNRRADYFFISEEEAIELVALSGLLKTDFKYIKFNNMPEGNKRYLLFSKMVSNTVIEKINLELKKYLN